MSFAFLTTGLFENLFIDQMMFGYIRDYLVIPFGVADFCGQIALILLAIKIFRSSEFRNLLLRGVETEKAYIKN